MRASGDFFRQYSPSLYRLLLLKPPEYNHVFFVHAIIELLTLLGLPRANGVLPNGTISQCGVNS